MTRVKNFDVAVVGAGVFGAWTALQLRREGLSVVLLDGYGAGNSRSSSGGESRVIRMGYGADEIYTRWAMRSLALWRELFERRGEERLFKKTGVLWLAREGDALVSQTLATLRRLDTTVEELDRTEMEGRFPRFDFGPISWGLFESESGALMARQAVQSVAQEFRDASGEFFSAAVLSPVGAGRLNNVSTSSGERIHAGTFVFACGPWLPKIFPMLLTDRIHTSRQEVFFFGTPAGDRSFKSPAMPVWVDFGAEVYGIPDLENRGFKMALDRHGPPLDPDSEERTVTRETLAEVRAYRDVRFPVLREAPLVESRVCQYENTSNGDFLIDRHPDFENVWLVGGGSGHGFKHGPALGEYVAARMTKGGETEERFSLATKEKIESRTVF